MPGCEALLIGMFSRTSRSMICHCTHTHAHTHTHTHTTHTHTVILYKHHVVHTYIDHFTNGATIHTCVLQIVGKRFGIGISSKYYPFRMQHKSAAVQCSNTGTHTHSKWKRNNLENNHKWLFGAVNYFSIYIIIILNG